MLTKTTYGFVMQNFDEIKREWVSQEFIAGSDSDDCNYEHDGEEIDADEFTSLATVAPEVTTGLAIDPPASEPYLPFHMVQPGGDNRALDLLEELLRIAEWSRTEQGKRLFTEHGWAAKQYCKDFDRIKAAATALREG